MDDSSGVIYPRGLRDDGLPAALSDPARLAAVRATGMMDTDPEAVFDDLAQVAAGVTGCARAFVTFVDGERSFWKACLGVPAEGVRERQNSVRESFCSYVVGLEGEPFVVDDARSDPRTRRHPSVEAMKIGAWAGHPILGPGGEVLGSVCVIDTEARTWSATETTTLATLARAVGNELHLRQSLADCRAALETSRELAVSFQDSFRPPRLAVTPDHVQAAASFRPAVADAGVGGDFYDLYHAKGPWWCAYIGDVCGKGIAAAKETTLARYTLRAAGSRVLSPAAVCNWLNEALIDQRGGERFLTAAYATFRPSAGGITGRLCLAGHPPALIRRADGRVQELGRHGSMLGTFREVRLTDVRFRLAPGDLLLLYTDGATDARPPHRPGRAKPVPFGEEALARVLAQCHGLDAEATIARLNDVLDAYGEGWAADDTALLALRVPSASERVIS
ncbi:MULTISPECIES: GAF domain-containing SpoIIE family protein phosphatase [unclassified Streptomyces]|uniref:PP2C family protein-serine/threonine phosphatase n=1 Tax=unclassified Streptomyces TaxID=2593676 RepID=UPI000DBACB18|nr:MULTISPECIES: GAF domain-containing SpoIIE family protein phosphatase [unclassified Streptomyces]MYT73790.1 SpoIIE family protein phosphatase [Streptomyces sp. SID8367]RAJ89197.1 serine phosphatase RsbU (regulator of sigma subunit) [Streptomyces sp. PsTaAH-137]